MSGIGNRVPFHPDEVLTSFLSRLSMSNFSFSAREFCSLLGMDFQKIVAGDRSEVAHLLTMAGIDPDLAADRVVSTDRLLHTINGETLNRASLVRSRLRYCPCCLEDDIRLGQERREARPYVRMQWLLSFVRSCPVHGIMLQEGVSGDGIYHDYAKLIEAEQAQPRYRNPSIKGRHTQFERYVTDRLWGRRNADRTWIDGLPLYVAGRLCEWVGATIMFGKRFIAKDLSPAQWSEAAQTGFDVVSKGRSSFVDFLKSLHDTFWEKRSHVGGRVLYGRLYERLAHETDDAGFDEIRMIMTETAIAHLPMGPGDEMFGPVTTRKLHSIQSVSKEMSVHPKTLRKLLQGAGWITADMANLTAERILFDASDLEAFVESTRDAIGWSEARTYMNASRAAWNTLSHEGFIPPAISSAEGSEGISPFYHRADLDHFLERLRAGAKADHAEASGWVSILDAAKKANCRYGEIIELLLDGKLENASAYSEKAGLEAIVVDLAEVREKTKLEDHGGLSLVDAGKSMGMQSLVLEKLIDRGYIAAEVAINPVNRCPQRIVRPREIDRFESEYVSLFNYAKRLGIHFKEAKKNLEAGGVAPALTKEVVAATFYRWADIRAAAFKFAALNISFAFA
ncbi:TniQ family protein [Agrobacterium sp. NPDC090273]|uniref:TniQ family protein n=1 Tax=Agrobacterium sp. NPDC090273 TaxID=3363919 RepID=UPI00383A22A4